MGRLGDLFGRGLAGWVEIERVGVGGETSKDLTQPLLKNKGRLRGAALGRRSG